MTRVDFTVAGEPIPQGSMRSLGAGRPTIHSNQNQLGPWRATVAAAARQELQGRPPLTGPVELAATFVFSRPRSHYRTGRHAGELRPSAPAYCSRRPDLDKLLRAIGDAVTGIVVVDDAQLAIIRAEKVYGSPCVAVTFVELLERERPVVAPAYTRRRG